MIYIDYMGHLVTDGELDELHKFARELGLKMTWFQSHPRHPHYDLTTKRMRAKALICGAVFVSRKEISRIVKIQYGQGNIE